MVCKDPGGLNGILPVLAELRRRGRVPTLVVNGAATELLAGKENFIAAESAQDLIAARGFPRVLVTSMCSNGGVGRDLIPLVRGRTRTVALQDFWGSRIAEWNDERYRPEYIYVNDQIGKKILVRAWPDLAAGTANDRIRITGYPSLDKYAAYDADAAAYAARTMLGLTAGQPIVLYGGQVKRSGSVLAELVDVLNELRCDAHLVPRAHPRMHRDAPEEIPLWNAALERFTSGTVVADSSACDLQSLIAAATVVVAMFSTILVEAAVLRKQNISVLYPEVGMAQFKEETRGIMDEFPLVELGCSAKASSRGELARLLADALRGALDRTDAQRRAFVLDGNNAARAADHISSLL